jgi:hypothetical protein
VSTWTPAFNRPIHFEEQLLYDHLLELVQTEFPEQLVQRFRRLFIDGSGYPDREVLTAVDRLVTNGLADQEFRFILNRCCHILINRWQTRSQLHSAIPELVSAFQETPAASREMARSRVIRRLRELVQDFTQTEQYLILQRLARVIGQNDEFNYENVPVGSLIPRYPYLYEHCLVAEGSPYEHQQTVRAIQTRMQRRYEQDLSQFVTYQVRRSQISRSASPEAAKRLLHPAKNPTLLSDQELCSALQQFVGKSQGFFTYRDLAQQFTSHSRETQTFRVFKDDLYEYLIASINPGYGKRQFNELLYKQLKSILADSDSQRPNDFLLVRTCSQLLNLLVVENSQNPRHYLFVDMITNLGATVVIGLLLKILLICRKIKPYLEKRFAILFNHYELSHQTSVHWLVEAMETMNLALSTNFSTLDLSVVKHIQLV